MQRRRLGLVRLRGVSRHGRSAARKAAWSGRALNASCEDAFVTPVSYLRGRCCVGRSGGMAERSPAGESDG